MARISTKRIVCVHPRKSAAKVFVIVQGHSGRRSELAVHDPFVLLGKGTEMGHNHAGREEY